jgi:hypothetical protein
MRFLFTGAILTAAVIVSGAAQAQPATTPVVRAPVQRHTNYLGQPDLQGVWSMNSLTKLERPRNIPNLVLTPEQVKTPAPQILPNDGVGTADTDPLDPFRSTWSEMDGEYRSSWLISPSDGRLPYSEAGRKLLGRRGVNDGPEGRSIYERCIYMPQGGPPMLNAAYNNSIQIMQIKDAVVIFQEANHEIRTIRMNTRVHGAVPRWFGDSVGWWEGDTLVVETAGFTPSQTDRRAATGFLVMSPNAKVLERFTRISERQIKYEFSVDDPEVFTQVWKGEIPVTTTVEPMFVYDCHEGNYGLSNILSGARQEEKRKAETVVEK